MGRVGEWVRHQVEERVFARIVEACGALRWTARRYPVQARLLERPTNIPDCQHAILY